MARHDLHMPDELFGQVQEVMSAHDMASMSETLRHLIRLGVCLDRSIRQMDRRRNDQSSWMAQVLRDGARQHLSGEANG